MLFSGARPSRPNGTLPVLFACVTGKTFPSGVQEVQKEVRSTWVASGQYPPRSEEGSGERDSPDLCRSLTGKPHICVVKRISQFKQAGNVVGLFSKRQTVDVADEAELFRVFVDAH